MASDFSIGISGLADRISPDVRRQLRLLIAPVNRRLPGRRPHWGNIRRAKPFSANYGWDRGQPMDRLYIDRFVERMSHRIRGDVLEMRNTDYTRRFGAPGHRSHVLDIDPSNSAATIIGDLCDPRTLAPDSFDCVILTQTLQFLLTPDAALTSLFDSLRSGGTMLITVPCTARIDPELHDSDYWRWTPAGLREIVARQCEGAAVDVEGGGNLTTALGVMLGCAVEDLRPRDLAGDDPMFPVIACAVVTKFSSA